MVPHAGIFQKNPRVRKIFVRNSGAGNGRANFMDTWKKCVRSAGKKPMSIKFLLLGGGIFGFGGRGGECRFYFYGRADFSDLGIFRLFRVFSGTFVQNPKKTFFETFLGFRARRPGDSCKWSHTMVPHAGIFSTFGTQKSQMRMLPLIWAHNSPDANVSSYFFGHTFLDGPS